MPWVFRRPPNPESARGLDQMFMTWLKQGVRAQGGVSRTERLCREPWRGGGSRKFKVTATGGNAVEAPDWLKADLEKVTWDMRSECDASERAWDERTKEAEAAAIAAITDRALGNKELVREIVERWAKRQIALTWNRFPPANN